MLDWRCAPASAKAGHMRLYVTMMVNTERPDLDVWLLVI